MRCTLTISRVCGWSCIDHGLWLSTPVINDLFRDDQSKKYRFYCTTTICSCSCISVIYIYSDQWRCDWLESGCSQNIIYKMLLQKMGKKTTLDKIFITISHCNYKGLFITMESIYDYMRISVTIYPATRVILLRDLSSWRVLIRVFNPHAVTGQDY